MCAAAGGPKHSLTPDYRPTSSSMNCHASAGLTLDRYRHLYVFDVDAVGHAINEVLTVTCGHGVGTGPTASRHLRAINAIDLQ
jgi:hypothetical protein